MSANCDDAHATLHQNDKDANLIRLCDFALTFVYTVFTISQLHMLMQKASFVRVTLCG